MGRRGILLEDEARWVFNRLASDYRARPPYPAPLVERLAALAGGPGARLAELGAGTGQLALPLAALGLEVTAVEPARAMLAVLEEGRLRLPGEVVLSAVHATAEASLLPGQRFDLVLVADALHWVDPELAGAEVGRLLAPGGALALVEAAFAPTAFMDGLAALLAAVNPRSRPRPAGAARQLFALGTGAAAEGEERFLQEVPLEASALPAVVRSLSYAGPALGEEALAALTGRLQELARRTGGSTFARTLTLRWGRRRR